MSLLKHEFKHKLLNLLTCAFDEFMKRQVALAIQEPFRAKDWTTETRIILKNVTYLMSVEVIATFKNKLKIFLIACDEAESYLEVVQAKNKLIDYILDKEKEIRKLKFESKEEFLKMIAEFLPEYEDALKEHWKL